MNKDKKTLKWILKLIEDIILTYTNLIAKNLIHISDPKIEAYQLLHASIQNDIININKKLGYVLTCNWASSGSGGPILNKSHER